MPKARISSHGFLVPKTGRRRVTARRFAHEFGLQFHESRSRRKQNVASPFLWSALFRHSLLGEAAAEAAVLAHSASAEAFPSCPVFLTLTRTASPVSTPCRQLRMDKRSRTMGQGKASGDNPALR
jgi:hypothetical protein